MAKYYYNDVLLPEIPSDVLAEYPYAWIRETDDYYELLTCSESWYFNSNKMYPQTDALTCPWYKIEKASAETAIEWVFGSNQTLSYITVDTAKTILWSSHNVANGSADASEIYFYGWQAIPENGLVDNTDTNFLVKDDGWKTANNYSYCNDTTSFIRLDFTGAIGVHVIANSDCGNINIYFDDDEPILVNTKGSGENKSVYSKSFDDNRVHRISICNAEETFCCFDYFAVYGEPLPYGSYDTQGSEPEPTYDEKYAVTSERLISFADTARKIVGSTATMTPEEMSTAFGNVQTLIDTANAKTGGSDTDLTSAVGTLVEGYGSIKVVDCPETQAVHADKYNSANNYATLTSCTVHGSNDWVFRTYLKHDLSGIPRGSSLKVIRAELYFYCQYLNDSAYNAVKNYIAPVWTDWNEETLTWNNQPQHDEQPFTNYLTKYFGPPPLNTWGKVDITDYIKYIVEGDTGGFPYYGLMFGNLDEGSYRLNYEIRNRRYSADYATYIKVYYTY